MIKKSEIIMNLESSNNYLKQWNQIKYFLNLPIEFKNISNNEKWKADIITVSYNTINSKTEESDSKTNSEICYFYNGISNKRSISHEENMRMYPIIDNHYNNEIRTLETIAKFWFDKLDPNCKYECLAKIAIEYLHTHELTMG